MSRTWSVAVDPAHCQNWALEGLEDHRGLRLLLVILRGARIPHTVTRERDDTRVEAAA